MALPVAILPSLKIRQRQQARGLTWRRARFVLTQRRSDSLIAYLGISRYMVLLVVLVNLRYPTYLLHPARTRGGLAIIRVRRRLLCEDVVSGRLEEVPVSDVPNLIALTSKARNAKYGNGGREECQQ